MHTIVYFNDAEASFTIPSRRIVDRLIKKGCNNTHKKLKEGVYYSQLDLFALLEKKDAEALYRVLLQRGNRGRMITVKEDPKLRQKANLVWDIEDIFDAIESRLKFKGPRRVKFLRMWDVFEGPHEVLPKKPYRTEHPQH